MYERCPPDRHEQTRYARRDSFIFTANCAEDRDYLDLRSIFARALGGGNSGRETSRETARTRNSLTRSARRVFSVVELCQSVVDERGGSSGLSVLRTFRLLRILKLVRFLPNLRRQLFVMLRTMDNVAVFFSLLVLFIFIFR